MLFVAQITFSRVHRNVIKKDIQERCQFGIYWLNRFLSLFQAKQMGFRLESAREACKFSGRSDDPMARHDD
jgi:hypothetical protein